MKFYSCILVLILCSSTLLTCKKTEAFFTDKTISCENENQNIHDNDISEDLNKLLKDALVKEDYERVEEYIEAGADANCLYNGEQLLYYLAKRGQISAAIKAVAHGADIQWMHPAEKKTAFYWAIQFNDMKFGKALLDRGVDVSVRVGLNEQDYLSLCIERQSFPQNKKLYMNYDFALLFLSYDYVKSYLRGWTGTLYQLIYRWTEKTPELIETIYGKDYQFPDEIPVLLISILNKDALEYFIGKGVDPNKSYYDSEEDAFFTPLELALLCKGHLIAYGGGDGVRYDENSDEVQNINDIIEYLELLNVK